MAMEAQPEKLAYVALLSPIKNGRTDAIAVIDVDPESKSYGRTIGSTDMPVPGDELHHFGWNACSSCLCPYAPHPHMDRRYLIVPGLHSSRVHILDTKPDPVNPKIVKVIEPETLMNRAGYSRPHTVHCGPEGIYMNGLGSPSGEGPGGIFLMDPQTFEIRGAWEAQRGPQYLAYDFAWHLGHDAMVTSEWGTPNMFENGLDPELLLGGKIRPSTSLLGSWQTAAQTGSRSRTRATACTRAQTGPQSHQSVRIRRRRYLFEGLILFRLALAPEQH
jgi:selenium-binding protein 1